jgi:hypothetical protein
MSQPNQGTFALSQQYFFPEIRERKVTRIVRTVSGDSVKGNQASNLQNSNSQTPNLGNSNFGNSQQEPIKSRIARSEFQQPTNSTPAQRSFTLVDGEKRFGSVVESQKSNSQILTGGQITSPTDRPFQAPADEAQLQPPKVIERPPVDKGALELKDEIISELQKKLDASESKSKELFADASHLASKCKNLQEEKGDISNQ